MSKEKDKKLLLDFFSKNLSEDQKKDFLEKASSDPKFLKEFIKGIELESSYEVLFGKDEDEDEDEEPVEITDD